MIGRGTLTRNDKGQYVPFASRALNDPALAKALAGKPLHAQIRKLGRAGHDTEMDDQSRMFWGKVAANRRRRKAARATRRQRKRYNRRGHVWHNGHPSAMSSRSW